MVSVRWRSKVGSVSCSFSQQNGPYRQSIGKCSALGSRRSDRVGISSKRRLNRVESFAVSKGALEIQRQPLGCHCERLKVRERRFKGWKAEDQVLSRAPFSKMNLTANCFKLQKSR